MSTGTALLQARTLEAEIHFSTEWARISYVNTCLYAASTPLSVPRLLARFSLSRPRTLSTDARGKRGRSTHFCSFGLAPGFRPRLAGRRGRPRSDGGFRTNSSPPHGRPVRVRRRIPAAGPRPRLSAMPPSRRCRRRRPSPTGSRRRRCRRKAAGAASRRQAKGRLSRRLPATDYPCAKCHCAKKPLGRWLYVTAAQAGRQEDAGTGWGLTRAGGVGGVRGLLPGGNGTAYEAGPIKGLGQRRRSGTGRRPRTCKTITGFAPVYKACMETVLNTCMRLCRKALRAFRGCLHFEVL